MQSTLIVPQTRVQQATERTGPSQSQRKCGQLDQGLARLEAFLTLLTMYKATHGKQVTHGHPSPWSARFLALNDKDSLGEQLTHVYTSLLMELV